jgi:uncharacterized YigZ family protein
VSDASRYPVPAGEHRVEQVVQRSRFIATIGRASSVDEAVAFVRRISEEFADATHNCWAYAVGRPGSTDRVGMSDDGEPHGTAGRPMLAMLLRGGVGDVAAVVTRYYGGTKLGTGGLVRAYGGSVQLALDALPLAERIEYAELTVIVGYAHVSTLHALLPTFEAEALGQDYLADVTFRLRLPVHRAEEFRAALTDATRGSAKFDENRDGQNRDSAGRWR